MMLVLLCFSVASFAMADETVLADNDQLTVKINGFETDETHLIMKATLVNKTELTLMMTVDDVVVNGYCSDPFWTLEVDPGATEDVEITWYDPLSDGPILPATKVSFTFVAYDTNDWSADHILHNSYVLYPTGEETVTVVERKAAATDVVLVDNDQVSVIITGNHMDDIFGYTVDLYLVNKTDKALTYTVDNVTVNGADLDPFWATTVQGNSRKYTGFNWIEDIFEVTQSEKVEAVNFVFAVFDSADWSADYIYENEHTYNP